MRYSTAAATASGKAWWMLTRPAGAQLAPGRCMSQSRLTKEPDVRIGTRVTRAGLPPSAQGAPFLPGPTFAGTYHAAGDPASAPLTYGRFHNPTWTAYEQVLSELEGGASPSLCVRYGGRGGYFWGCPPPWR